MEALSDLVARIVELKKQQAPPEAIEGACRAGTAALLHAREAFRAAALASDASRERAAAAKADLDRRVLRLQSILYEGRFYDREITACTSYKSAYPDALVAPPPGAAAEQPPPAGAGRHAREVARLTAELAARKALCEELSRAQAERQREAAAAAAAKARVDALKAPLRGLGQAGRPLLSVLGTKVPMQPAAREAGLLPAPLWAIYSQFGAARDALGLGVDVRVEGSAEAAQQLAAAAAEGPGEAAACSASAAADGPAAKRQRREELGDRVYEVHPLSLVVSISGQQEQQQQPALEVRFQHYSRPGLVGASCGGGGQRSGDAVLGALFPGDAGDGEGFEVLAQLAGPGPYKFGSAAALARPYRWAQDLAGADVIPSLPPAAPTSEERAGSLEGLAAQRRLQRVQVLIDRLREAAAHGA